MHHRARATIAAMAIGAATSAGCTCSKSSNQGTTSAPDYDATPIVATPADGAPPMGQLAGNTDGCDLAAINLGAAHRISFAPPDVCRLKAVPIAPIKTEEQFRNAYGCTAASGIDFTKNELRFAMRPLSPATVGITVVDDGKVVTFVSRQRQPCPNEPAPMPVMAPIAYVHATDTPRKTSEAVCPVEVPCRQP